MSAHCRCRSLNKERFEEHPEIMLYDSMLYDKNKPLSYLFHCFFVVFLILMLTKGKSLAIAGSTCSCKFYDKMIVKRYMKSACIKTCG